MGSVHRRLLQYILVFTVAVLLGLYTYLHTNVTPLSFYQLYSGERHFYSDSFPTSEEEKQQFWHNLTYSNDNNISYVIYFHRFYLDNRNTNKVMAKSFMLVPNEFPTVNMNEMVCLFHKTHFLVTASAVEVQISKYKVDETSYKVFLVICSMPQIYYKYKEDPMDVSVSLDVRTFRNVPVVQPFPGFNEQNESIGVCLTAQYGSVNDEDALFFVQWMETLLLFGVSEVTLYNMSMKTHGLLYNKVLQYYIDHGFLNFNQFPSFSSSMLPTEMSVAESLRSLAVNDCFYKNMHKFWKIIHIDKDELIVPLKHKTYQEFLYAYMKAKKFVIPINEKREIPIKDIYSLAVPSAFYYKNTDYVSEEVPSYFPLLRQVFRQPTESFAFSPGYTKSFINTRTCNHVWSHRCVKANDDIWFILPESDIIIHHYRNKCPSHVPQFRLNKTWTCKTEYNRKFKDDFLGQNYGDILRNKTLNVLNLLQYFKKSIHKENVRLNQD